MNFSWDFLVEPPETGDLGQTCLGTLILHPGLEIMAELV